MNNSYNVSSIDIIKYYNLNPDIFKKSSNYFVKIRWLKKYLKEVKGINNFELPIII